MRKITVHASTDDDGDGNGDGNGDGVDFHVDDEDKVEKQTQI